MFEVGMAEIGRAGPPPTGREANYGPGGMVFAGGPNEVADRILQLHELLGHSRQILQMDVGGMPQATFLRSIELLGTRVLPQVRKGLATPPGVPSKSSQTHVAPHVRNAAGRTES
jgi:hypothetical protein